MPTLPFRDTLRLCPPSVLILLFGSVLGCSGGGNTNPPPPLKTATTTSLTATATALQQGLPLELVAVVMPAGATGSVTFSDGTTSLGSASLDANGRAIATTTSLGASTHSVTASYSGDANTLSSNSAAVAVSVHTPSGKAFTNPLTLNVPGVGSALSCADPAVLKVKTGGQNTWFLYCTSDALTAADKATHYINVFESQDLVTWTYDGDAFAGLPAWATNGQLWAPAIKFFNDQYYLYYATPNTTLAGNGAAVGVGVSASPRGPFLDHGAPVVEPEPATNCCGGANRSTIDPDEIEDASGQRYILFGSFVGGISVRKLSADGFSSDKSSEQLIAADNRYEGGNWWFHSGYYYLFASSTDCCRGPLSGYGVFVGRATTPLGPYLDAQGNSLTSIAPGGNISLAMNGNSIIGPGGNVLFTDEAGQDYMLYHGILAAQPYYPGRGTYTARPALIDAVDWVNGWPVVRGGFGPSDSTAPQPVPAAQPADTNTYVSTLNTNDAANQPIATLSDEFNTSTLSSQWSFIHGQPSYTLTANAYQVQTVGFDTTNAMAQVPLLSEPAPKTDYLVETKLSMTLPLTGAGADFAQAGLLIYGDDSNYLRLDLYSNSDTRQIEFIKAWTPPQPGYPTWGATNLGPPSTTQTVNAWLRIAKRTVNGQETYTAYSSSDGVTFTRGGTWTHTLGANTKICIYAGNRTGYTASFDYIHISTLQ